MLNKDLIVPGQLPFPENKLRRGGWGGGLKNRTSHFRTSCYSQPLMQSPQISCQVTHVCTLVNETSCEQISSCAREKNTTHTKQSSFKVFQKGGFIGNTKIKSLSHSVSKVFCVCAERDLTLRYQTVSSGLNLP